MKFSGSWVLNRVNCDQSGRITKHLYKGVETPKFGLLHIVVTRSILTKDCLTSFQIVICSFILELIIPNNDRDGRV